MSKSAFLLVALAGGLVLPLQVAINGLLKKQIGHSMQATLVSFVVGAIGALAVCAFARHPLPSSATLSQAPWWMWLGGFLGTFYVWSTITAAPQIGAGLTLALAVAGQMIAAVMIDHYGMLGIDKASLSFPRIAGVGLIVVGVVLVSQPRTVG